jgi:hypothetical protein
MCDPTWRAIEIDADGWRIVDMPSVRFRRTRGKLPIPAPNQDGRIEELRNHLHVDDDEYILVVSWLLAILRERGPYPILALTGEAREVARTLAKTQALEQSCRDRKRVEMLFAHLKRILKVGRLRLRGPRGAQDEFTLAAIAQNLRRLAKLAARPPRRTAAACVA